MLRLDTTISSIRAAIGSANIRRYMVDSEEGRVPAYSLRICGHAIQRSQEGVSWTDPAYRSPEGLGVGSTLSAFDSAFGIGKISADHGLQVRYELDRYRLYVEVTVVHRGHCPSWARAAGDLWGQPQATEGEPGDAAVR